MGQRRTFAVVLLFALAAVLPASASQIVYNATLTGFDAFPPNASPGSGHATVTVDPGAHTMRVSASFSDLLGPSAVSHIHCCTADAGTGTAGAATTLPTFLGFPLGVTAGTYDQTFDLMLASTYNPAFIAGNGGTAASASAAFLDGLAAGAAYFDVHTSLFPGGEIRGLLAAAPIPEPEVYALMLFGLAVMDCAVRRRRPRHA